MPEFKAAIFDLDGTLIDSMGVWEKIDVDFLTKRGLPVPETYTQEVCSKSFPEAAAYTIALFGLKESVEDVVADWNRMAVDEYSHRIRLKPHAKEYLLFLKEHGVRLGTATALPRALYEPVLKNNGVYGLFDAFASVGEVSRGKESPELYLLAAGRLGAAPADCAVFEDVLRGIRGIRAAGMRAFGVHDRYAEHEEAQIREMCERYVTDFAELMPPPAVLTEE